MTGDLDATDRALLQDLVHRYAAAVDDRDPDAVADLFTPDATLVVPDPPDQLGPVVVHHGPDGVRAALTALGQFRRTVHEITGLVLEPGPGPDTVRGRVSGVAHHYLERDSRPSDVCWRLRYDDRYVRTEHGWRLARRAVTVLVIETPPVRQVLAHLEAGERHG